MPFMNHEWYAQGMAEISRGFKGSWTTSRAWDVRLGGHFEPEILAIVTLSHKTLSTIFLSIFGIPWYTHGIPRIPIGQPRIPMGQPMTCNPWVLWRSHWIYRDDDPIISRRFGFNLFSRTGQGPRALRCRHMFAHVWCALLSMLWMRICFRSLWSKKFDIYGRYSSRLASFSINYIHMGVSENSVPLNPMVNDHYPY